MKEVITYDELLESIPNKYILTITAGKRARDIGREDIELKRSIKEDTLINRTFKEIKEGKISYTERDEKEKAETIGVEPVEKTTEEIFGNEE